MVYINGEWRQSDKRWDVVNPATGEAFESVAVVGREETKEAIAAAKAAFGEWKKTTGKERGDVLAEVVRLMSER
jgi:succinate-semialdehyde dehydrogenase/glutarate-semialdehyde dehydrogenase